MRTPRLARTLDNLWYAASAPQTFVVLAALLAATLAFAAIIPQRPAGLDAASSAQWLTSTTQSYRNAGSFLRGVGAFELLSGAWFRALLAALAFHLALRLPSLTLDAARTRRPAAPALAPAGLRPSEERWDVGLDRTRTGVEAALGKWFGAVQAEHPEGRSHFYAQLRPAGAFGAPLAMAGLLAVGLGLLVNDTTGWRAADITLPPGRPVALAQAGGLQITLEEATGRGRDAVTKIALARGVQQGAVTLRGGWPGRWDGMWLAQRATGAALTVTATGAGGQPLRLQALGAGTVGGEDEPLAILFRGTQSEQGFAIPGSNLTFRAVSYPALPERGIAGPVFLVEAYTGEETIATASELVEAPAQVAVEDVTLSVTPGHYSIVEAARLPGLPLLAAGVLAALAGAVLALFFGTERAWVDLAGNDTLTLAAVRYTAPLRAGRRRARLLAAIRPQLPEQRAPETEAAVESVEMTP